MTRNQENLYRKLNLVKQVKSAKNKCTVQREEINNNRIAHIGNKL